MTPPALKASCRPRLAGLLSLVFLMLAGFALPQQAAAQNATVSIGNASVAENGGNAEFTVSLPTAVTSDVVLAVAVTADTATLADLGADLPPTVTIKANTTEATLMVPIANDNIVEGNETFTVTLSEDEDNPLPEGVTIRDGIATGAIEDDDRGLVRLSPPTATVAENGTFAYTVRLSAPADEAVNITWTATAESGDTATVADDLQRTTGTVTFNAGANTNRTFNIAVNDDAIDESDETFTVTISATGALPARVVIPTSLSRSAATITDNDDATVSIDDVSEAENVANGNATFTAALTAAVDSPVVLAVGVTAGTATLGVDLGTPLPTTVTIDANTTEATFTVPIVNDDIVEGNETFTVTLSENDTAPLPEGVTIRDGTATGTITEDDAAEVTLGPDTLTAAEDGEFTYTVSLSAAADEAVTVRWTATDGGATVADDLQAATGTVTFNADTNTAQTFTIRPVNDTDVEDDETFTVTLGPDTQGNNPLPAGVTIGTNNSSAATITGNDGVSALPAIIQLLLSP